MSSVPSPRDHGAALVFLKLGWFDDEVGSIPLSGAVFHPLATSAELIESGHSGDALRELERAQIPLPMQNESHYLKGICRQSLGDFNESRKEYAYVITNSSDEDLVYRAEPW